MKRIEQGEQWVRRLFRHRDDLSDADYMRHHNPVVSPTRYGVVTAEKYAVKPEGRTLRECEALVLEDIALCFLTDRREGAAAGDKFTPPKTIAVDGQPLFAMRMGQWNEVRRGGAHSEFDPGPSTALDVIYEVLRLFFGMRDHNRGPLHSPRQMAQPFVLAGMAWHAPLSELTLSAERGNRIVQDGVQWQTWDRLEPEELFVFVAPPFGWWAKDAMHHADGLHTTRAAFWIDNPFNVVRVTITDVGEPVMFHDRRAEGIKDWRPPLPEPPKNL